MGMLNNLMGWVDERFPATETWEKHISKYYAPKNFNFMYFFGFIAMIVLVLQIVTGVWLAMSYKPDAAMAFGSVEYIMRDVDWGWLLRYMHSTGASAFFIVIYIHMFRGLIYGSYQRPRELLWIIGVVIYLAMMATALISSAISKQCCLQAPAEKGYIGLPSQVNGPKRWLARQCRQCTTGLLV